MHEPHHIVDQHPHRAASARSFVPPHRKCEELLAIRRKRAGPVPLLQHIEMSMSPMSQQASNYRHILHRHGVLGMFISLQTSDTPVG